MITHTVSILELAWTMVAFLGLIFVIMILGRAQGDYNLLMQYHLNGLRKYAAMTSILIFLGGTITQISYMVVGVVAMTQPSLHNKVTVPNYISAGTFLLSSLTATVFAGVIWRRRVRIVEMLIEAQGENGDNAVKHDTPN